MALLSELPSGFRMRTRATVSAMQMDTGATMPVTSWPRSSSTPRPIANAAYAYAARPAPTAASYPLPTLRNPALSRLLRHFHKIASSQCRAMQASANRDCPSSVPGALRSASQHSPGGENGATWSAPGPEEFQGTQIEPPAHFLFTTFQRTASP